jgi:hypothetical protein
MSQLGPAEKEKYEKLNAENTKLVEKISKLHHLIAETTFEARKLEEVCGDFSLSIRWIYANKNLLGTGKRRQQAEELGPVR